jgi:phosphoribosylamine--glycine ligase
VFVLPQAKLLEHNVRFGDPECQSLMVRLQSDLLESLLAQCRGEQVQLEWSADPSLTVVLAAKGYPGAYAKGGAIRNLQAVTGAKVFHAGTSMRDGQVVSTGASVSVSQPAGPAAGPAAEPAVSAVGVGGEPCSRALLVVLVPACSAEPRSHVEFVEQLPIPAVN